MSSIAARLPTPIRSFLAGGIGSSLFSGLAVVFLLTLSGKFIAFVKEALVASSFGVADDLDVFMLVFSLMSFALTVIAGGLPSSFMSVYADLIGQPLAGGIRPSTSIETRVSCRQTRLMVGILKIAPAAGSTIDFPHKFPHNLD